MSKRITDPALEMRYGRREAERRLRAQRETERNAAIFNLTPEQYQTAQEVKDGRIVRDDDDNALTPEDWRVALDCEPLDSPNRPAIERGLREAEQREKDHKHDQN